MLLVLLIIPNTVSLATVPITHQEIIIQCKTANPWTNKMVIKTFYRNTNYKVKGQPLKRLKVTGQGKILVSHHGCNRPTLHVFVTSP